MACRSRPLHPDGTAFAVPDQGVIPISPCPQHTQWRSGPGLRRGSVRNVREVAERIRATVTVHRTAHISASTVIKPIRQAMSTGRSVTLLVKPEHYADT
jgi:hypothetical protein